MDNKPLWSSNMIPTHYLQKQCDGRGWSWGLYWTVKKFDKLVYWIGFDSLHFLFICIIILFDHIFNIFTYTMYHFHYIMRFIQIEHFFNSLVISLHSCGMTHLSIFIKSIFSLWSRLHIPLYHLVSAHPYEIHSSKIFMILWEFIFFNILFLIPEL